MSRPPLCDPGVPLPRVAGGARDGSDARRESPATPAIRDAAPRVHRWEGTADRSACELPAAFMHEAIARGL